MRLSIHHLIIALSLGFMTLPAVSAEQAQKPVAVKAETQKAVEKKTDEAKPEACQFKISLS